MCDDIFDSLDGDIDLFEGCWQKSPLKTLSVSNGWFYATKVSVRFPCVPSGMHDFVSFSVAFGHLFPLIPFLVIV